METRSKKMLLPLLCTISVLVFAGIAFRRDRPYASARLWHFVHGNYTLIGLHKIRLPESWWRVDDAAYHTPLLLKAVPSSSSVRPEIVVNPAITGEVRGSQQEELEVTEHLIALQNETRSVGTSASLVVLNAKAFTLYCHKEEAAPMGIRIYSHLTCHAAGVPYTFIYQGPPMFEGEAESILSTLE